jgi:hypothetical protein
MPKNGDKQIPQVILDRVANEADQVISHSTAVKRGAVDRAGLTDYRLGLINHYLRHDDPHAIIRELTATFGGWLYHSHSVSDTTDVCQDLYYESLRVFRREHSLPDHSPKSLFEVAEFAAFTRRYANRKVGGMLRFRSGSGKVARRRAKEVDIDGLRDDENDSFAETYIETNRVKSSIEEADTCEEADRLVNSLLDYFATNQYHDLIEYLLLRLANTHPQRIADLMGLTTRQRDHLQQRFVYQVGLWIAASESTDAYHDYFGLSLANRFGLGAVAWDSISAKNGELISLKRQGVKDGTIARVLSTTEVRVQRRWKETILEAKQLRNA